MAEQAAEFGPRRLAGEVLLVQFQRQWQRHHEADTEFEGDARDQPVAAFRERRQQQQRGVRMRLLHVFDEASHQSFEHLRVLGAQVPMAGDADDQR